MDLSGLLSLYGNHPCVLFSNIPLRSEKAGRLEKLLGCARSHSIVTRGSVSISYATTKHPSYFSKSQR